MKKRVSPVVSIVRVASKHGTHSCFDVRNRRRVALAPEDIQRMVVRKPDSLRAVFYALKLKVEEVSLCLAQKACKFAPIC